MFDNRNFTACITGQLAERGFGTKRKGEILDRFNGLAASLMSEGYGSQIAQSMAMNRVFAELSEATLERAKRAQKTLEVVALGADRIAMGKDISASVWVMDGAKGRGGGIARALVSMIVNDPRFPGLSAEGVRDSLRGRYWAIMADALDNFGKGAYGTQKGKAGLWDIVREVFGQDTKNADAREFAKAYLKLDDIMVADRNKAGASLKKLDTYFMPQRQNAVKVSAVDAAEFIDDHMKWLDWNRMRWPDGSPIAAADRPALLNHVYETLSTDGKTRIEPGAMNGRGSAVGNSLDEHRMLTYKDADSWIAQHEKYGDGNVFDVIQQHVEHMAHNTGLIHIFGPNPQMMADTLKAMALKQAGEVAAARKSVHDIQAVPQAEMGIKNRFEPMFEQFTRSNAMSQESQWAAGVLATANVLTAAKLGSVPLLAVAGDFHQTLAMRFMNNMPLMDGIGTYLKGVTTGFKDLEKFGARAGHVFDSTVGATYTTERFSPIATYGGPISRKISDAMIRTSGLARHTEIARATVQKEFMGLLSENIGKEHADLPFTDMMARYGIGKDEWDAARGAIKLWEPEPNAEFFRPLDLLDTKLPNKDDLYMRFASMISQESKNAVPGSTLEASIVLRGASRPDTLPGALLHSFAMYKNFPITFTQMYGRLALAETDKMDRAKFLAAIFLGSVAVGAMGVQLREVTRGKTALPMNTATFWGKAALAGGGMSLLGDFLFGNINQYGQGASQIAGPVGGFAIDAANLVFGDPFKFVSAYDKEEDFKSTFGARAGLFLKQNTPGTSLWWARLAIERTIWDTFDETFDKDAKKKQRAKINKQEDQGNRFWSAPGSGLSGFVGGTR